MGEKQREGKRYAPFVCVCTFALWPSLGVRGRGTWTQPQKCATFGMYNCIFSIEVAHINIFMLYIHVRNVTEPTLDVMVGLNLLSL